MVGFVVQVVELFGKVFSVVVGVFWLVVIVYCGVLYDVFEEIVVVYLLVCDFGVDYLEVDVQCSCDGVLVVFYDDILECIIDVVEVFLECVKDLVSSFIFVEFKCLDVGFWFNCVFFECVWFGFVGLCIFIFDEMFDIVEGGVNKLGLYLEIKVLV